MKIHEFCKLGNTTKKTVRFYIEKKLLCPKRCDENGYYDFCEDDLKQLQLILLLRSLDLSIHEIQECFSYPTLTNYFLHRHIHDIKTKIKKQMTQLECIYSYLDDIPPNATPDKLLNVQVLNASNHSSSLLLDSLFPEIDSRMIAIVILAPFLAGNVNEYQKFLWDKISLELQLHFQHSLVYYQRLIYNVPAKQIVDTTSYAYHQFNRITHQQSLSNEVKRLLQQCEILINDNHLLQCWNLLYDPILKPTLAFFKSNTIDLMKEYNSYYEKCISQVDLLIQQTYEVLLNSDLHQQIQNAFQFGFHISDLFLILYFDNSIYVQFSEDEIKELILIND